MNKATMNMPDDLHDLDISFDEVVAINSIIHKLYRQSKLKGWHPPQNDVVLHNATKIALIHSEISEALEGMRKGLQDDHLPHRKMVEVELADAIIRILDLAGSMNLDVAGALAEKHNYNRTRADHKPENRAKDGGKKF